jgi:hypothetical protein
MISNCLTTTTMNIDNPSPSDLIVIGNAQQRRWAEIDAQPVWSDDDFEEAVYCKNVWFPETGTWNISITALEQFAFDPRTPEDKACKLRELLIAYRQQSKAGQP